MHALSNLPGRAVTLAVMLAAAALAGCPGKSSTRANQDGPYDRAALLASLGENVFLPAYREAAAAAVMLKTAADAYSAAVAGTAISAPVEKAAAQAAWRDAMRAWQSVEMYQIGPAADPSVGIGGEALRDKSYSWPTVNPCRIDQELVAKSYANAGFFESALVIVSGLDALEYLLFYEKPENSCLSPQIDINASGSWAAISPEELIARRAAYAAAAAAHLATTTQALVDAWAPEGGNFLGQLKQAGTEGSVYEDRALAIDQLFRALYYLELTVKDLKVAKPLGLDGTCSGDTCALTFESRYAKHSKENITANLRAFERAFIGGDPADDGFGFDDALAAIGKQAYAADLLRDTQAAIAAFEAIPGSMEIALTANRAAVEKAYTALKLVTDELKSELAIVLQLQIPAEGAGDAD